MRHDPTLYISHHWMVYLRAFTVAQTCGIVWGPKSLVDEIDEALAQERRDRIRRLIGK